jgi:drug/metabolite transporter (DMT)-like permease
MIAAILILSSLIAVFFGYRMFCMGPAGAMRRFSGAVLAIAGVIVLVGCARHRSEPRELTVRHAVAPRTLRFLKQERTDDVRLSHDRVVVEKFI